MCPKICGYSLLFLFLTGLKNLVLAKDTSSYGVGYFEGNCQGEYMLFQKGDHHPSLPDRYENQFRSVKIRGIWLFYEHNNYNQKENGLVEYYYMENMQCRNLGLIQMRVKSIRYGNDEDNYERSRLDTYRFVSFQGSMHYANGDMNTNMEDVQSVMIGGTQAWTIFSKKDYKGDSICLVPQITGKYQPTFISDLGLFIPFNFAPNSYRRGCHSYNVIHL